MILVQNSMSLAFSNAFIPTSQFKCLQKQRKRKSHNRNKTRSDNLLLLNSKGLSTARPLQPEWKKAMGNLHGKKAKSCSCKSRYEDPLFITLYPGRNKGLPTQGLLYNPPIVYILHFLGSQMLLSTCY